jgi:acyl dehydratase
MSSTFKVGDTASIEKTFTEEDVQKFSELSLDKNPVHLDPDFATQSIFGERVVHGMLVASLFSAILGTTLPGEGTIYLRQTLNFLAPLYLGDKITASVEIVTIRPDKPIITLRTTAVKDDGTTVIEGEAVVKVP